MSKLLLSSLLLALLVAINGDTVSRQAIAILTPSPNFSPNISGHIVFTETDDGLHVYGNLTGMPPGKYGLHVHEFGDVSTCYNSGAHFNPENTDHGGRNITVRHVGDLGNVVFVASEFEEVNGTDNETGNGTDNGTDNGTVNGTDNGTVNGTDNGWAIVNFTDHLIALRGENSILGRTLVLHEEEDDLGQGGNPASLITGNSGARVACGVIGIRYPSDPWITGSAATTSPSLLLFTVTTLATFFCFIK
ncbi:unnamed protein product [Arctia plantaginis]|uniref:Superoxide dismutase [Cu-Zn] n=1 Tax=Arctia plantaginis TaxID=874455 RepID=A0A8S1BMP3_ARCPL|nr:unnamed protein product [Arctia plantaginis]CAB3261548.1 unnamed protein product [Arctia plantaginis]